MAWLASFFKFVDVEHLVGHCFNSDAACVQTDASTMEEAVLARAGRLDGQSQQFENTM